MMEHFLTNVLLAVGLVTSPTPTAEWSAFAASPGLLVEIDAASLKLNYNLGWEVTSKIRLTFDKEFEVKGKAKKGKYYVDSVTAICRLDKIIVNSVTAHAKDGEILAFENEKESIKNPHEKGHFVTEYLDMLCLPDDTPRGMIV